MAAAVAVSNYLVLIPINDWFTAGTLTYPLTFLLTDVTNRVFGKRAAQEVVFAGFCAGLPLSLLLSGPRIAIASGTAYLTAQFLDVSIFSRLRNVGPWWVAPLTSTVVGSAVDSTLFVTIAFIGQPVPWVTWGIGDFVVKVSMAFGMLLPFRAITLQIAKAKQAAAEGPSLRSSSTQAAPPPRGAWAPMAGWLSRVMGGSAPPPKVYRPFEPTAEWQRVEDDHILPPGLDIRLDVDQGGRWARLPAEGGEAAAAEEVGEGGKEGPAEAKGGAGEGEGEAAAAEAPAGADTKLPAPLPAPASSDQSTAAASTAPAPLPSAPSAPSDSPGPDPPASPPRSSKTTGTAPLAAPASLPPSSRGVASFASPSLPPSGSRPQLLLPLRSHAPRRLPPLSASCTAPLPSRLRAPRAPFSSSSSSSSPPRAPSSSSSSSSPPRPEASSDGGAASSAGDSPPPYVPLVRVDDFDYELPSDRVAVRPCEPRDASRLLVWAGPEVGRVGPVAPEIEVEEGVEEGWALQDAAFMAVPELLPREAMLILNDSRVIAARLTGRKVSSGGRAEVFLLAPLEPSRDPGVALNARSGESVWECFIGGRKVKVGEEVECEAGDAGTGVQLRAEVLERSGMGGRVRLRWAGGARLSSVLEAMGRVPLPPYIKREADAADRATYQTAHAQHDGSVAAPTAGLHLSTRLMDKIRAAGTEVLTVTLHVGAGTFKPVDAAEAGKHEMHAERIGIQGDELRRLLQGIEAGKVLVPVGTTTVRTLESLYWWGVKLIVGEASEEDAELRVEQWDPYRLGDKAGAGGLPSGKAALEAVERWARGRGDYAVGYTSLMIVPGYRFVLCDMLFTNTHQPRSTLLMLVSALVGSHARLMTIYTHALQNSYRFLSYGDGNLLQCHPRSRFPLRR